MNGKERNLSQFRKLSAYIMQDNQLHANLTVEEAMHVAASLKLSQKVEKSEKLHVVSTGEKGEVVICGEGRLNYFSIRFADQGDLGDSRSGRASAHVDEESFRRTAEASIDCPGVGKQPTDYVL